MILMLVLSSLEHQDPATLGELVAHIDARRKCEVPQPRGTWTYMARATAVRK